MTTNSADDALPHVHQVGVGGHNKSVGNFRHGVVLQQLRCFENAIFPPFLKKLNLIFFSQDIAVIDPQSGHAISALSLQTLSDYTMATHTRADTQEFATTVDAALRKAHARALGVDLLQESGHLLSSTPEADPSLTAARATLKSKAGGAAIRPLTPRLHALNSMCNALPRLIDAIDATGNTTPGFFNRLSDTLGQGSFDSGRENTRWAHFPGSGRTVAADFRTS